jgi:N4-gp56 family major capsid protein
VASAYTGRGDVTLDQTAYDRAVYHGLRRNLYFDRVADVRSTAQSMPGSAVIFNIATDMAPQTATLDQSTDVDAVALADAQVTLTLLEKGNAVITTASLRGTSYVPYDPVVANIVMYNAAQSLDILAGEQLGGGSNVRYSGQAVGITTVIPTDVLAGTSVARAHADLKAAYAMPWGDSFVAFIHPHVEYDLRVGTDAAAWRAPHIYSSPGDIWAGQTGWFEGFRFISTAAPSLVTADAGSSTTLTDVYKTLFVGQQALAKAYSYTDGNGEYPQFVLGPVVDKLRRNVPVGWYWFGVYGRFREASLRRVVSASSIGTNS